MITIKILVINLGSSSLKYKFFDFEDKENCLLEGHVDGIGQDRCKTIYKFDGKTVEDPKMIKNPKEAIKLALKSLLKLKIIESWKEIDAIGHRVVHGGDYFKEAALLNNSALSYIKIFSDLAPLHNPIQLEGITACKSYIPNVKQVAVFDTAFHQTMPPEAYMYGLPLDMCKKDRIRKYGFHGSSHKYVSGVVHNSMKKKSSKTIVCHLGSGSSIAAVKDLESIDTTMGFTPTDGLVMGTRVGSMDPMAIIYMIKQLNMTPTAVEKVLNDKSGFLGMTQMVADLRDVYGLSQKKNVKAVDAMNKFIHQVKSYVGGYTAIMGGVDAIAFTAGIGENAEYIRESVCEGLSQLGVKIDKRKNKKHEFRIDAASSKVKIFVVPTNEELQIARETHEKLEPFIKK